MVDPAVMKALNEYHQCDENHCPSYDLIHALMGRLMVAEQRIKQLEEKLDEHTTAISR